jgi:SAM-dependent methyltransferase/uncharacterized protein YbaR (Trm112 family)
MESRSKLLDLLACPECKEPLTFKEFRSRNIPDSDSLYGVLSCSCYEYPVLDSVPIILRQQVAQFAFGTGAIDSSGLEPSELVQIIKKGNGFDALLECLTFTPTFSWMQKLPIWRLWNTGLIPKLGRSWIKNRIKNLILSNKEDSLEDWLELFFTYMPGSNGELLHYYKHRFVLPRTLATYSTLELLNSADKPILDIACGIGPFPRFMVLRNQNSQLIGFDFNFYLAWWQRRFMAPQQLFLCADGGKPLPFKDASFGAVYCSDSFMFIPNKEKMLEECQRCAPNRPLALTRVGNRDVYPNNWGQEMTAIQYADLLGDRTYSFRELDLVRCYLDRTNPLTEAKSDPEKLNHDKWLYFIKNMEADPALTDICREYPHELGELTRNPIFNTTYTKNGRVRFDFSFPSIWFTYQNADMLSYHGDKTEVKKEQFEKIRENYIPEELKHLVQKFIIIGLPKRYLRKQLNHQK